ncbi:hypothetical protein D3C80_992740 [compost metagenome]
MPRPAVGEGRRDLVQAQQHGEHGDLAGGGKERRHRRRGAFVDVRGPQVEGHQRQLEGQADQHHADADLHQLGRRAGGQRGADGGEAQAAGLGVQQGHAEQQEGAACGGEHHVLDAGFQRAAVEEGVGDQPVGRYRQQLQADEQAGQVLGADQHDAAGAGQQHQQVQLLAVARIALARRAAQIGVGQGQAGQGGSDDHRAVIEREAVDAQQRGHLQRRHAEGGDQRQQGQVEADHREQEGLPVVALPGDRQHHGHGRGAGDQQRQQGGQVLSGEFHSATYRADSSWEKAAPSHCCTPCMLAAEVSSTGCG